MINPRAILLLTVALGAAAGVAFFVKGMLTGQRAAPAQQVAAPVSRPAVEVLVAKRDLATGVFVKADDLVWREWPEDGVTENFTIKGKGAAKEFEGGVVRSHLFAGEPITKIRLAHPGERGFLAVVLEPGKRAVAIPVDGARGAGGFVFPGDRVDVIMTVKQTPQGEDASGETRHFAETLLTDVRVLAIDQAVDVQNNQAKVAKTATIEVSQKQAERVALGLELGDLSLSLRSLQRHEGDLTKLVAASSAARAEKGANNPYTRDTDILSMIGDPWGLPPPAGLRKKVNILRGSESKEIRY